MQPPGAALDLGPVSCWTGRVAVWAPFPSQQQQAAAQRQQQQQQGGGLPALKTSSSGVWLKSDAGGVLAVQWRPSAPPLLTCTLRTQQQQPMVRAPLAPGTFAYRLLCPQHGAPPADAAAMAASGGGSGHLLFLTLAVPPNAGPVVDGQPNQQHQEQHGYTMAVHFDSAQSGQQCGALLQAIQQGSLAVVYPAPPPGAPTAPAGSVAPGGPQQQAQQQQEEQRSGSAMAAPPAVGTHADPFSAFSDEASLLEAVQASWVWPLGCLCSTRAERCCCSPRTMLGPAQGRQCRPAC